MFRSLLYLFFILSFGLNSLSADDDPKKSTLQWKWAMESLRAFSFKESDQVLDLGCGDGSITAEIAARVPLGVVVGVDIPEKRPAHGREYGPISNVIYMQADAKELPFVEEFDKARNGQLL